MILLKMQSTEAALHFDESKDIIQKQKRSRE